MLLGWDVPWHVAASAHMVRIGREMEGGGDRGSGGGDYRARAHLAKRVGGRWVAAWPSREEGCGVSPRGVMG